MEVPPALSLMVQSCGLGLAASCWPLMSDVRLSRMCRKWFVRHCTWNSPHVQNLVITFCFSPRKCKQFTGDVLFVARQLRFLFFFPWSEHLSSNLTVGEVDAEFSSVFSAVNTVPPFLFQGPSSKAQNCAKEKWEEELGTEGQQGFSLAFPILQFQGLVASSHFWNKTCFYN